jgi:hypothetical protein
MSAIDLGQCQVCGKEEAVGVACSGLGAVSLAYGRSCLDAGAEPYDLLVATVAMCGGRAFTAEWVPAVIAASLIVAGKTLAEFDADVAKVAEEMAAGLGECEEAPSEPQ